MSGPFNEFPESADAYPAIEVSIDPDGTPPHGAWTQWVAWIVIVAVCTSISGMVFLSQGAEKDDPTASPAEMMGVNSNAKMMVGQYELSGDKPAISLDTLNQGALEQRYGVVLLKNELESAKAAEKLLTKIDELVEEKNYKPTKSQQRLRRIVGTLLEYYKQEKWDSSVVSNDDREFLVSRLGWVGRLALTPENSPNENGRRMLVQEAKTSFFTSIGLCLIVGMGLIAGIGAFVTLIVMGARRRLRSHFFNGNRRSIIYLETFAIWLLAFSAAQIVMVLVRDQMQLKSAIMGMALTLGLFFGSLIVLVWPVIRGITFSEMRRDIGWTARNPFKEVGLGVFAYCALAPFIGVLMLILAIVMAVISSMEGDSLAPVRAGGHPIQDQIASGDPLIWIGVFLTACVAAPIVEETMFRGVFYRYLKDASSQRAMWFSVLIACLVNSFVFAVIHPQGLFGLPFLTLLAVGMSLARQWRDSLIASITMHAMNNGLITCLMFAIF